MSPKQLVLDFEWTNIVTQIERLPLRERERNCLIAIARLAEDWQTYEGSLAKIGREMGGSKSAAKRATDFCVEYGALRIDDIDARRRRFTIDWLTVIDAPPTPSGLYDRAPQQNATAPTVDESAETVAQIHTKTAERSTWFFAAVFFVVSVARAFHLVWRKLVERSRERATWAVERSTYERERATSRPERATCDAERSTSTAERSTKRAPKAPKSAQLNAERSTCERSTPLSVPPASVPPPPNMLCNVMSKYRHKHEHLPSARARGSGEPNHGGWPKPIARKMLLDRQAVLELHVWAVDRGWIDSSPETLKWFFALAHHVAHQQGNHGAKFTAGVSERWRDFPDKDWEWAKLQLQSPRAASVAAPPPPDTRDLVAKEKQKLADALNAGKFTDP